MILPDYISRAVIGSVYKLYCSSKITGTRLLDSAIPFSAVTLSYFRHAAISETQKYAYSLEINTIKCLNMLYV